VVVIDPRARERDPATVREFCRRILEAGDLDTKLEPPAERLSDQPAGPSLCIDGPARDPGLEMRSGVESLPRPGALASPQARAVCLARFAHHELMAVELFAWALLRWPELPAELRRGLLEVLADEQRHCRLYVDRLRAHGSALSEHPQSSYFWRHAPAIAASPHGPLAFLCAMGLTFEQANLDFTLVYRDGFRAAGDEASALVCQSVHDDEIGHVRLAANGLRALAPRGHDEVETYRRAVPYPLAAARAKGRRFAEAARRRAGLSAEFIAFVRDARSSQEQFPGRDPKPR
jgi:uncharacterized ferritin-like protein (DUF455 family)